MLKPPLHKLVPLVYLAGALPIWVTFALAPPDGLANVGLAIYTLPVVLLATFVLKLEFPYLPGPYYIAHTLYFVLAVAAIAALMYLVLRAFVARRR